MTQPALRPPSYLQPRPKAAPTFSSTSLDAIVTKKTPPSSRASSRARQLSPSRPPLATDVSDKATSALIRRVLCPHSHGGTSDSRPIDEVLPPLTSSNDVDLQLYAIIAIVVKEFVYSWYGKITPDQGFVEEVVRIFAHCTRALEQRLRRVDIEGLVFDEVPELVESHVFGQYVLRRCSGVANTGLQQHGERVMRHNTHLRLLPTHASYTILSFPIQHFSLFPIATTRPLRSSRSRTKPRTDNYSSRAS